MTSAFEVSVIAIADFAPVIASKALGEPIRLSPTARRQFRAFISWLNDVLKRPRRQGALCAACDAEFQGDDASSRDWAVAITTPTPTTAPQL